MAREVFVKFVHHPGTSAQPFLGPALKFGEKALKRLIPQAVTKVMNDPSAKNKRVATLKRELTEELDRAVRVAALATQASAIKRTPVASGRLRQSINIQKRDIMFYTVGTNVKYARWVEEGTRPHIIRVKNKKALHFFMKDSTGAKQRRKITRLTKQAKKKKR